MSRARNIKPGFFKNDLLVELAFEYRLLFVGLWTMADRDGRLEDRPTKIRMEVFPADSVDVDAGLQALHDKGFIQRYEVDGTRYLQVLAWVKHQNPHVKEAKSTIPAPCKPGASPVQDPAIPERAGLIPDSGFLIPDSSQEQKPVQRSAARFDLFWSAYPVKKGRAAAEKSWRVHGCDLIADAILAHVLLMQANDTDWRRGFIPHGSTYVNGKGWLDEPKRGVTTAAPAAPSKTLTAIQNLEGMKNGMAEQRTDNRLPKVALLGSGSHSGY